jgi:DNA-binding FadR family transcriptional regulator
MVNKYGMARATVREALRILEVNGLVELRAGPRGGPTVRSVTPADFGRAISLFLQAEKITLQDLFSARRLIEPVLVRDAAEQQDPEYLARAKDLIARGRSLDIENDAAYIGITREFHELTVSGSPNRVFRLFALALMSMFIGGLDKAIYSVEKRKRVMQEHEDILKAIIARDAGTAEKLMTAHMKSTQESIASRYASSYQDVVSWR